MTVMAVDPLEHQPPQSGLEAGLYHRVHTLQEVMEQTLKRLEVVATRVESNERIAEEGDDRLREMLTRFHEENKETIRNVAEESREVMQRLRDDMRDRFHTAELERARDSAKSEAAAVERDTERKTERKTIGVIWGWVAGLVGLGIAVAQAIKSLFGNGHPPVPGK